MRRSQSEVNLTTPQRLASVIKAARDIMRKDKGLNGDLDRLPMLTWLMFLKFLDDSEMIREEEAKLDHTQRYHPAIDPPYRWRDWAAMEDGITGDELIAWVNQDEAVGPDGKRRLGLLPYLRTLQSANGHDRRKVIATEAKPLPYMLAQMNLLLHGLEYPQISDGNSLAVALNQIGDKERVDVILTNPPFGGEEEKGILSGFPEDKRTSETALLFLQLIMRRLRRQPKPG